MSWSVLMVVGAVAVDNEDFGLMCWYQGHQYWRCRFGVVGVDGVGVAIVAFAVAIF
jgi:hypothetical protein